MSAIVFDHLYFRYGEGSPTLLRDLSLELDYGKFVLITGHSGSGKSTIMNLINGAIPNYVKGQIVGDILIDGESNKGKSIGEISLKVGSVLQNADLQIIHDLVDDEIAFGLENLAFPKEKIAQSVDKYASALSLDPGYETKKLSGGQKQRLISSSTLAMSRKIIILDEPLANLDFRGAKIILDELKRLTQEEGYLVILIEHRLDNLGPYVDECYVLGNESLNKKGFDEIEREFSKEIEYEPNDGIKDGVVLSCHDVTVSFRKRVILENVSFQIQEGERVLILGENGVGKTTLSKVLARLIKPEKGKIESSIPRHGWFKNVGYIFQNPDYQLFMPSLERELSYACKDEVLKEYAIKYLGLEDILDRHPYSLSEGQKRKVAALAIILMKPRILFLDEPTVGQDDESLIKLISLVNKLNKENGTTIISITHDKRCAKALCDKAIWLKGESVYKTGDNSLVDEYFSKEGI